MKRRWEWWDRHHATVLWAIGAAIVSAALGAWIGTWASCSASESGCRVRWQAVEAIGTWVGALGGILAVMAAIATYRSGEQSRLELQRRESLTERQLEAEQAVAAARVTVRASHMSSTGDLLTGLHLTVFNGNTKHSVYQVKLSMDLDLFEDGLGARQVAVLPEIAANGTESAPIRLGGPGARSIPPVSVPKAERSDWLRQLESSATMTYTLDDVIWERTGDQAPRRLGLA